MNYNKLKRNIIQIGGRKLGEGGFGCVITPAISCNTKKNTKTNKINEIDKYKYVSKLISKKLSKIDLDFLDEEIYIYKKLKKIDKTQQNYIYPINICKLDLKQNLQRKDIKKVKFLKSNKFGSNSGIQYYTDDKGKKKSTKGSSKYCLIDQKIKPLNIIFPYGGVDLFDILKLKKYSEYRSYYKEYYPLIFYKLLQQIRDLHNINVIHSDIKLDNIISLLPVKINNSWVYKDNLIKLIDFGLSYDIKKHYTNHIYDYAGTEIPLDIYIAHFISENKNSQIYKIINELRYENEIIEDFCNLYDDNSVRHLINKLYTLIKNNKYKDEFIKDIDGISYKSDIYSIGMTFVLYMAFLNIDINEKLADLLKNMLNVDPISRYNINNCLDHNFFDDIKKLNK